MNKLLIVFLAVCLVSTQAFVRRDSPTGDGNYLDAMPKKLTDLTRDFNNQMTHALDPETVRRNVNTIAEAVNKMTAPVPHGK